MSTNLTVDELLSKLKAALEKSEYTLLKSNFTTTIEYFDSILSRNPELASKNFIYSFHIKDLNYYADSLVKDNTKDLNNPSNVNDASDIKVNVLNVGNGWHKVTIYFSHIHDTSGIVWPNIKKALASAESPKKIIPSYMTLNKADYRNKGKKK